MALEWDSRPPYDADRRRLHRRGKRRLTLPRGTESEVRIEIHRPWAWLLSRVQLLQKDWGQIKLSELRGQKMAAELGHLAPHCAVSTDKLAPAAPENLL